MIAHGGLLAVADDGGFQKPGVLEKMVQLVRLQGQVAQLFALTKLVVPNPSVCPGWGEVTITPTTPAAGA